MSETIAMNIEIWRKKCRDGTITKEEMRDALAAIRKDRIGASATSAASKEKKAVKAAKEAAPPIDSDALIDQLM